MIWLPLLTVALGQAPAAAPTIPPAVPVVRLDGVPSGTPAAGVRAPQPPARPGPVPMTQLDDPARVALDGSPSVSLAISRPMALRDLLRLLVTGTPLSIVFDERVEGEFEGDLRGLTLRQAIEAVLFPRGLDYDLQGTLLRIFPLQPRTRLFELDYLNVRRTWLRGVRSAIGLTDGETAAHLSAAFEGDPLADAADGVRALLSSSGRVHVDRASGVVQVTDFADRLDQVGIYLEAIQLRASRQVRLEARVLEVTLTDPTATLDWGAVIARAAGAVQSDRRAAGVRVHDFDALLRAMGEQGTVRAIATPQVLAMNNEPALMRVGVQGVSFEAASRLGGAAPAIAEGLTLTVIPQVAADGIVQLHVSPTYAERAAERTATRIRGSTALSVVEAETQVRVQDGHTVVIAGLLQDRTRTKPGTGFAGLFGAQTREQVTSELIILLTPTVVFPGLPGTAGGQ